MIGPVSILQANTVQPDLLNADGVLKLLPSESYDAMDSEGLRLWCHHHARYGLPTTELVAWLVDEIGHRRAIEIGAGTGDLCRRLGIPGTDNYCQTFDDVKLYYKYTGQPLIQYPDFVERLSAKEAIAKYQPQVVVASWVTQWIDPNLPPPPGGGNVYGIEEDKIVAAGITYILIGNETVHGGKKIMKLPHETIAQPWIRSRSKSPNYNRIWIWNR